MNRWLKAVLLITGLVSLFAWRSRGQEDAGWRISPEKINIQASGERPLQVLDDSAQELRGARWSVDNTSLAEIKEENGRATVHAKAAGTIRVSAVLGGQTRVRDIQIWPADQPLPQGTTTWGMHPIGREIGDLAAVPVEGGTDTLSLEQPAMRSWSAATGWVARWSARTAATRTPYTWWARTETCAGSARWRAYAKRMLTIAIIWSTS